MPRTAPPLAAPAASLPPADAPPRMPMRTPAPSATRPTCLPRTLRTRLPGLLLPLLLLGAGPARSAGWEAELRQRIERIDRATPGTLGVYVKRLDRGEAFSHGAERMWYLGSTTKVPIAVAVLQQVDAGRLRLSDALAVEETDKIDGPGELVWGRTGARHSVDSLLRRMLDVSDNTAATMLVRAVGEDALNRSATAAAGGRGFGRLTSLAQVRYDVYAELHPQARALGNRQLVEIAAAPIGPKRVEAVRRALDVPAAELRTRSLDEAYARYYRTERNSATLEAYGGMLEQLVRGRLLQPGTTRALFDYMKFDIPGDYRFQGGLPKDVRFIHKTGTQHRRACHAGVISPQDGGARAIVVATCAADLDEQREAGAIFRQVGQAVTQALLRDGSR